MIWGEQGSQNIKSKRKKMNKNSAPKKKSQDGFMQRAQMHYDGTQLLKNSKIAKDAKSYARIGTKLDIKNSRSRGNKLPSQINKDLNKKKGPVGSINHRTSARGIMKSLHGESGGKQFDREMSSRRKSSNKKLKKVAKNLKRANDAWTSHNGFSDLDNKKISKPDF